MMNNDDEVKAETGESVEEQNLDMDSLLDRANESEELMDAATDQVSDSASEEEAEELSPQDDDSDLFALDAFSEEEQEDMLWQAKTGLNFDTLCAAIETIIFMSDRPITLQKIKSYIDADMPLRVLHDSIARLQEEYERNHHGLRLQEVAEGYQFRTKAIYSRFVLDMFKITSLQLTPTALEVLAIIAYRQPVSRQEVDKIRGVDSSHIVRALMDKRLVKITGRSEELGKPVVYGTTSEFLEVFNLRSISDLPPEYELEEMSAHNEVGAIRDIREIIQSSDAKRKFSFNDVEELDSLKDTIQSILTDTDFTKSLKKENDPTSKTGEEGVETPRRSAFDILEDFVNREEVANINMQALDSELLTSIVEARVVDLQKVEGLLNAPEPLSEEDDLFARTQHEGEEDSLPREAISDLREMRSEEASDVLEEEFHSAEQSLDEEMDKIDSLTEKIQEEAQNLDINLNFAAEDEERTEELEDSLYEYLSQGFMSDDKE